MLFTVADAITREWIRNASDELAAKNGCRFDLERATFAKDWIERYCVLYEGEHAGENMVLRDWQYDFIMRLFGWVKFSEERGRELRRFRRASLFISKKNKKTPTIAAVGLFMLIGDGEQGQKVYTTAKDGKQAGRTHEHAIQMVNRSPELLAECTINKTTGRIVHHPSQSFYDVLSGDNIDGQEGINGSVMCDEVHVVDERLMKVISRAGISRAEPIHLEVSTAGNNPDSYGKQQFDRAVKIAAGEIEDEGTLAVVYACPQDLKDSELEKDPVKYGKMANPAWGHTVFQSEFLDDYANSKESISKLADFKMYRLNIWQRGSNPWLKMSDWNKCKEDFKPEEMEGQQCFAALDLMRVSDMAAFGLVFPHPTDEKAVRLLVWHFLPEEYAKAHAHEAPFMEWQKSGHLILMPGNTIDYPIFKSYVWEIHKRFSFNEVAYDEMFADQITQEMVEELGVERLPFPQTMKQFGEPTDYFESLVMEGRCHHNGDPVLAWQAGHVEVIRDSNGNKKPSKPGNKKDGVKKIDAIVALVMALQRYKAVHMEDPYANGGGLLVI